MTDEQLVEGLKQRNPDAAHELYVRFAVPLLRYFQVALPDPSFAEDAVQEVFCRFLDAVHRDHVRGVRSLNALLFTIARRLAIDVGRTWQSRPHPLSIHQPVRVDDQNSSSLENLLPDHAAGPREEASNHERQEILLELLRELDPETREIIVLRHIEGFSSQHVAKLMGLAEGTVWSRLHRGIKSLRQRLERRESHQQHEIPVSTSENADAR